MPFAGCWLLISHLRHHDAAYFRRHCRHNSCGYAMPRRHTMLAGYD